MSDSLWVKLLKIETKAGARGLNFKDDGFYFWWNEIKYIALKVK